MENAVATILLPFFSLLGGAGIVSGIVLRKMDKMDKKSEKRAEARKRESVIILSGVKAVGHLAEATAIAQRDGKTNGEMKIALEYYHGFNDELNGYLLNQNAEANHGR